ncbi:hypothetical protein Mapa_017482 [Marchantia paleacea]|nr:hypothetical protein Mapa_017482 [Marchantia paleacea]
MISGEVLLTYSNKALLVLMLLLLLVCNLHLLRGSATSSSEAVQLQGLSSVDRCGSPESCRKPEAIIQLEILMMACKMAAQGEEIPVERDECCLTIRALDPPCLCRAFDLALHYPPFHLNITAALRLPRHCGYNVPTNCICNGFKVPT